MELPPKPSSAASPPLTLVRLLSHSAGLTVHGFPGYPHWQNPPSALEVVQGQPPANTEGVRFFANPGTQYQYSGGGTTVTQLIAEDITEMPYHEFMEEMVLGPLSMERSTYAQPLDVEEWPNHTKGHLEDGLCQTGGFRTHPEQAAAGLWTTPTDLSTFLMEIGRGLSGESDFLPQSLAERMTTPVMQAAGLGLFITPRGGVDWFGHGGSNIGYKCDMQANSRGDGIVVMTNGDEGSVLVQEIQATVASEMGWEGFSQSSDAGPAIDSSTVNAAVGEYRLGEDRVITLDKVSLEDGSLGLSFTMASEFTSLMIPQGEKNQFALAKVPRLQVALLAADDGSGINAIEVRQGGPPQECLRWTEERPHDFRALAQCRPDSIIPWLDQRNTESALTEAALLGAIDHLVRSHQVNHAYTVGCWATAKFPNASNLWLQRARIEAALSKAVDAQTSFRKSLKCHQGGDSLNDRMMAGELPSLVESFGS